MQKVVFFMLIMGFGVLRAHAQNWYNDPEPYPGAIVLKDKTLVRGNIQYNQQNESIRCRNKNGLASYTADDVVYFQFYDVKKEFNRYFFSLISNSDESKFYELLLRGDISIYRKSYVSNRQIDSRTNSTFIHMGRMIEHELYFPNDGKMMKLKDFEGDILPLMNNYIDSISNYVVLNKLNLKAYEDQVEIIDFYNSLASNK